MSSIPVITIDGVGGSGKGSVAQIVAKKLDWHYLDSGAIYRALGLLAIEQKLQFTDEVALADLLSNLDISIDSAKDGEGCQVIVQGVDISKEIRSPEIGVAASRVSVHPLVRSQVNKIKRSFLVTPGLVTDGRDMGSVVFPDAPLKIYLDASVSERAKRRHHQLQQQGFNVKFDDLLAELEARDLRDKSRNEAPLVVPEGAHFIDTSTMSLDEVVSEVMTKVSEVFAL